MDLLPLPIKGQNNLQTDPQPTQPLHDIRELFELAFPLLNDHDHEFEDCGLAEVIPFRS